MIEPEGAIQDRMPPWLRTAPDAKARIRAALRCGAFLLLVALSVGLAFVLLRTVLNIHPDPNAVPPLRLMLGLQCVLALSAVIVPTGLLVAATRDGAVSFGWGTGNRIRDLAIGAGSGIAAMALLIGLIAAFHGAGVHGAGSTPAQIIVHGLGYLGVFALVAICEEGLLRGYMLIALSRAISFWPAAVITSVMFALLHASHGTETLPGLANAGLSGLVLAYSLRRSGSLWFAWGWHAAWDFAETFLFGAPDSGMMARSSLLVTELHGPAWMSGGSAGPEGSWLVLPVLALVALLVRLSLSYPPASTRDDARHRSPSEARVM